MISQGQYSYTKLDYQFYDKNDDIFVNFQTIPLKNVAYPDLYPKVSKIMKQKTFL
jgi:hypothetical protein